MGSHPDADLHASATGPAAKIVEVRSSSHNNIIVNETLTARQSKAHQKEEPLKLYSGWFCPFVQRAWTVLEEKSPSLPPLTTPTYPSKLTPEIPYQYIEVNPYNKPQSLLSLNPRGLVPTLQYENKPLYESTVICEFLEEAYPDHTPHLLPKDPYDRARTRIWTDFCTSRIIPAFHRFLQFQPMSDEEGLEEARKEFLGKWMVFAKEMDESGPFFLGREPSLVDFVVAPWALRLWVFDHYKGGLGLPEEGKGGDDEATWARFRMWLGAIEERPSLKNTMSEREHYLPIYQRYADNTAQSELAKATRKGGGVP